MYCGNTFLYTAAGAVVPEQLAHYVRAVSGRKPIAAGEYVAYLHERHAVLAAYSENGLPPEGEPFPGAVSSGFPPVPLARALEDLRPHCDAVTVLAPFRPAEAPADAVTTRDIYWQITLPAAMPGQKLRNMLRRAGRDVTVARETWRDDHASLVRRYGESRPLPPGTRSVFGAIGAYVSGEAGNVELYAARTKDARLAAFLVADYTGLHTAFYMFAFREPDAPPGSADLLLHHLVRTAEQQGHRRVNLGLGITEGIAFFKKKWGAEPFLPYAETAWNLAQPKTSVFASLRSLFLRV